MSYHKTLFFCKILQRIRYEWRQQGTRVRVVAEVVEAEEEEVVGEIAL